MMEFTLILGGKMKKDNFVVITVTPGCSNKCIFCLNAYKKPLSPIDFRKSEINMHRKMISYRKMGYENLDISGSDPLDYNKLIPMIKYIKKIGFKRILLCTHGRISPNKNKIISELITAGVTGFRIPLYGSNSKIHESITRAKGSFMETINGINMIKKIGGVKLFLLTVIVRQNKEDILNITKLALGFKPNGYGIDVAHIYPGVPDHSFCVPYKDLEKYLMKIVDYKKNNNIIDITINDVPYCVLGFDCKLVNMPKNLFHEKPKGKLSICKKCKVSYKCEGFFLNDIKKFGVGELKPIL